jgi:hypothetical protein
MNRMLLWGMIVAAVATPMVATAQVPTADQRDSFRFELHPADGPRGRAVEGEVYNGLPWRITNVRLRVDSVDANGRVTASAVGWVLGDVDAGGRGYVYVPVASPGASYRATVQLFDKVAPGAPAPEAP